MQNKSELPPIRFAIKQRRKQLGLTQDGLARRTGLKRAYIGDIELKERNVSLKTLAVIAHALELTVSQLVALAEASAEKNHRDAEDADDTGQLLYRTAFVGL